MSIERRQFEWLSTEGGPLLLISGSDLAAWGGVMGIGSDGARGTSSVFDLPELDDSDYGRACAMETPISLMRVGSADVFLLDTLSDEVTICRHSSRQQFSIIRKVKQGDEGSTAEYIRSSRVISRAYSDIEVTLTAPVYLMDATIPGARIAEFEDYLELDVADGAYAISFSAETPDSWTELFIIDFALR